MTNVKQGEYYHDSLGLKKSNAKKKVELPKVRQFHSIDKLLLSNVARQQNRQNLGLKIKDGIYQVSISAI